MGSVCSQTAAHCHKALEEPLLWLCHALGLSCLSHCGWGSSEALLGRAASPGLSVLALGEMLPISHVSSPSQGSACSNCFVPPEKAAPSPHRSEIPWIPALLECLLSWLSAQWPYSWFLAGHAPLFPALVVQSISRCELEGPSPGETVWVFYHEGKSLMTTHSKCSQMRDKCSEGSFLHLSLWDEAIPDFNSQTYIGLLNIHLSKMYPLFPHNWISIFPSVLQLFHHVIKAITDSLANMWHACVSSQNDNFHVLTLEPSRVYSPFVCLLITSLCLATPVSFEFDRFFSSLLDWGKLYWMVSCQSPYLTAMCLNSISQSKNGFDMQDPLAKCMTSSIEGQKFLTTSSYRDSIF